MTLATPPQRTAPRTEDALTKHTEQTTVPRYREITVVPKQHRSQPGPLAGDGETHALPQGLLHLLEFPAQPPGNGLSPHRKLALPRLAVREAEKVKRLRFPLAPSLTSFCRKAAKLDEPGLLRVQFQVESVKPLPKLNAKPLGLVLVLKANDEVVAVAHDDDITARVTTPPLLSPEIKD